MGRVERFEDLIAWQKARALSKEVRQLTRRQPLCKDFSLCDQMRRSSRSIMSNIAEGFDRGHRGEFHQFVVVAKGSCAELRSDLYTLLDDGFIAEGEFGRLYGECDEVARILGGLRVAISRQRFATKS